MASILVVEDYDILRDLYRSALELSGYDVRVAENGVTAKNLCKVLRFDVLVTDLALPDVSATDIITSALAANPRTQVLVISGHPQDVVRNWFVQREFRVLCKPFELS